MTVELHAHDADIVDEVMALSDSRYEHGVVSVIVEDCVEEFDGAPIQDYVPVLVIKKAMDELSGLDPTSTDASFGDVVQALQFG